MERILKLITDANISDYSLEKTLGFTQGTISNWRRNKNKISTDAVIKLAKYFNVSTDYLLCLTDEEKPLLNETNNLIATQDTTLSTQFAKDYEQLLKDKSFIDTARLYNEIPSEYRALCFGIILGALQSRGIDTNKILGIK